MRKVLVLVLGTVVAVVTGCAASSEEPAPEPTQKDQAPLLDPGGGDTGDLPPPECTGPVKISKKCYQRCDGTVYCEPPTCPGCTPI